MPVIPRPRVFKQDSKRKEKKKKKSSQPLFKVLPQALTLAITTPAENKTRVPVSSKARQCSERIFCLDGPIVFGIQYWQNTESTAAAAAGLGNREEKSNKVTAGSCINLLSVMEGEIAMAAEGLGSRVYNLYVPLPL